MIATGSPRKRYDKAAKIHAVALVSIRMDGERPVYSGRSASTSDKWLAVSGILDELNRSA
jgi:histidyl-tRNA synthetase